MRILFIGCVEGSYRLLEKLVLNKINVVGVITKAASNFNADFKDLTPLCQQYSLPIHYVQNVNDEDSLEFINSHTADVCFCFGWSQLLKKDLIDLFPLGVVGFHPAMLPHNRGRHPLIWALALGLNETASTFFMINAGADEGDIVSQRKVTIDYKDDARTLYDKVLAVAEEQELELVDALENNRVTRVKQDINSGNSWRKRDRADGQIDWRMSSRAVYNLVRSLTKPYVGAHFVFAEKEHKVWKVQELDQAGLENIEPGKVLSVAADGVIDVKVYDGVIRLLDYDKLEVKEGDYLF